MRTAIIGTGAWGVALARILAGDQRGPVLLLGRDTGKCEALSRDIPSVQITIDPAAVTAADLVLWAVPCQFTRATARSLAGRIPSSTAMVSLAKGLERGSLERPSVILASELGCPVGALSGPSLAAEVAAGAPVALVCAGPPQVCQMVVERVHGGRIRIYSSTDLIGVEIAGALKNIVAIAAGMCDGLGLGDNAKAALVTRGLAEIRRLGRSLGADDATFAGLAGMGDLVATCWSRLSRNRALGEAVARGARPVDLLSPGGSIAEGAWTAAAALALAERQTAELPIASQVESVLWHDRPVHSALDALLARAPKDENA